MTPKGYIVFHLNLAFSSIEEEARIDVIQKCYDPLLSLIEETKTPIGIELTGWTLKQIQLLEPLWIEKFKNLLNAKKCELIGSGYSQIIGPICHHKVNYWNQKLAIEEYQKILGLRPDIILVNEMAFSTSMIDLYHSFGYKGFIMDRDNIKLALNQDEVPYIVKGVNKKNLPVLWSDSILFQKFQHFAHGDTSTNEYLEYVNGRIKSGEMLLPIYCNDAEVFDYRPGRFKEESSSHQEGEWNRIKKLIYSIQHETSLEFVLPSEAIKINQKKQEELKSEIVSVAYPIPVKKQAKYNIARWAVTGKDDLWINTMCHRINKHLIDTNDNDKKKWKKLCEFWASDIRTHITDRRWRKISKEVNNFLTELGLNKTYKVIKKIENYNLIKDIVNPYFGTSISFHNDNNLLRISAKHMELDLNLRRGLAIQKLSFMSHKMQPCIGTLPHGFFESILMGADFYSGNTTIEMPLLRSRATDLERVQPKFLMEDKFIFIFAKITTLYGTIKKTIKFSTENEEISLSYDLSEFDKIFGSARLGFITLLDQFTKENVEIHCSNGGESLEKFSLNGDFDHTKPASTLVSSSRGLGGTTGIIRIVNKENIINLNWDPSECAVMPMLVNKSHNLKNLARVIFSIQEYDDTLKAPTRLGSTFTLNISTK